MRPVDRLMSLSVILPKGKGKSKARPKDEPSDDEGGSDDDPGDYSRDESGMDYGYEEPMAHERPGRPKDRPDDDTSDEDDDEPDADDMGGPSDHDEDDEDRGDEGSGDDDITPEQLDVGHDLVRAYREGDARGIVEGILALIGK